MPAVTAARQLQRIQFRPSAPFDDELLAQLPEVTTIIHRGDVVVVTGGSDVLNAVITALARNQVQAGQLRVEQTSLEDATSVMTTVRPAAHRSSALRRLTTARAAQAIGALVFYSLIFFSALWLPIPSMPSALQHISHATPLGAAWKAGGGAGSWPHALPLLTMAACAVVFGLAAARLFRWK